jgi:integrase
MPTQVRILDLPPARSALWPGATGVKLYAGCKLHAVSSIRTPGTGGVIDLWKNNDGTPSKLATGRWAEGHGKPQGVGKRWRGWYVGDDGKTRTKRFRTEVEAESWANAERGKVVTNQWVSPDLGADAFATVAEAWFKIKAHCKPKTLAGYRSILDTLVLPRWGETPLKAITYSELSAWLSGLSVDGSQGGTGLSASRVIQTHQLMGAVYKYALKASLASKNVAAEIERRHDLPKSRDSERHYLTHRQLLDLSRETGRFETMTLVLGYCGLRFGEVAALRGKDIGDQQITVRSSATYVAGQGILETGTKTNRSRQVPVPAPIWALVKDHLPAERDALVFPSRAGGHLSNHEYRRAFDKALKTVRTSSPDLPDITPHDLRHTCASLAISAGANVKVVQRMLGHATAAMTLDLYGHLMSDDLAGVANALGKAIAAAQETAA